MTKGWLIFTAAGLSTAALAAPNPALAAPTPSPAIMAANQAKAIVFLDGVAASYRKLHSLSATWHGIGGYSASDDRWRPDFKSRGTLAWRHSKPAQARFENKANHILFVSDGTRHLIRDRQSRLSFEKAYDDGVVEFNAIGCDQFSKFLLNGKNPFTAPGWGDFSAARLLGVATVNGVRCRGVELTQFRDGRDGSTTTFCTAWFDARNLMRRYQEVGVESKIKESVDFDMHPNAKLSPSLFVVPRQPKNAK